MSSKLILLLGLFLAVALLISSEVAAASRDLAETTNAVDPSAETNGDAVNDAKYGGYGGYPGGGGGYGGRGGGYGGRGGGYGGRGGGGYGGGGGRGRGGYCRYGCCGRSYNGCRCCTFAGEKAEVGTQN
ncbi:glycine-rich protein 3-like [Salvia hispanica]|uniref:glycine-rich protein 3-like n=1 Tax=Salvia hispanica TaxID=49212 RepID=UPI0020096CB5|nr:glycine-rich protein 3-like [Salvia hispanica]